MRPFQKDSPVLAASPEAKCLQPGWEETGHMTTADPHGLNDGKRL